jgi:GTP cyclohydrolase I
MIPDVQNWPDDRGIGLDEVGITGVRYPVSVFDAGQGKQDTAASVTLAVSLPPEQKGSHLSRFIEVLDSHADEVTPQTFPVILKALQTRLGSPAACLRLTFPYFLRRSAPVSKVKALIDYGAHNQRSHITIAAEPAARAGRDETPIWLEDLIDAAEAAASSPVFPVLKRVDERQVTMRGYSHPVFVEDMARGVTERLRADPRVTRFTVTAESDESIHNHNAHARVAWPPQK